MGQSGGIQCVLRKLLWCEKARHLAGRQVEDRPPGGTPDQPRGGSRGRRVAVTQWGASPPPVEASECSCVQEGLLPVLRPPWG